MANSVKEINKEAFEGCTSLTSIKLSDNIKYIPEKCFANCTSLEEVILPSNLEALGLKAFNNCHKDIALVATKINNNLEFNQSDYQFYLDHLYDGSPEEVKEEPKAEKEEVNDNAEANN